MLRSRRPGIGGARWRAVGCAVLLAAVLGGCGRGDAGAQRPVPSPVRTVVAGAGGAVVHVTVDRSSFGRYGNYIVYLPPEYGRDPGRRYPAVYLLHGGSDPGTFFLDLGLQRDMDAGIRSGALGPMIVVLVDAGPMFAGGGEVSTSFDDYVTGELIPDVDHRWLAVPGRAGRAIGGVSVGGRHALEFAADHPSLVGAVGGHSTTVPRSPERLAAAGVPIYLDVGTGDGLFVGDEALATSLRTLGAEVRWNPGPGQHGRAYWSAHLPAYLRFYSEALGATGG